MTLARRRFLQGLAAAGAPLGLTGWRAQAPQPSRDPCFLVVLTAYGGASILDSVLALRRSECAAPDTLNCYDDDQVVDVEGTPSRAVDTTVAHPLGGAPVATSPQVDFVRKHARDLLVATVTVTSVNHAVAQWRSVTGNNAWGGRTLQEAVAARHGEGSPLPNVHLSAGSGFVRRGRDETLSARYFGEPVANPLLWPLGLEPTAGIPGAPSPALLEHARALRRGTLDPGSVFGQVFAASPRLSRWLESRREAETLLESSALTSKLLVARDRPDLPLGAYGLAAAPESAALYAAFPDLEDDSVEAQAALAFLLLKHRVATAVTLGPNASTKPVRGEFRQLPIAFDFSHTAHRGTQLVMWNRVFSLADRLIDLLRAEPFEGGGSLWDRTVLYIATDFGRQKTRPSGAAEWSSAHDVNNAALVLSPLAAGGRLLGGVDPTTGLTYGFDLATGAPVRERETSEPELYSGLLDLLGIDTRAAGLPAVTALRRT